MDVIIAMSKWQYALSYIGDTIIFSKLTQKHLRQLVEVRKLLEDAGVKIKLNKCYFSSVSLLTT